MANNEINDLTAKTTPVSTDEVEIQETAGGLSKKATVGNLAKGMSYNDLNDKPSIPTVSDTAYDATSWNGNTDAPTKNAVRDKIESMGSGDVVGPASATTGNIPSYNGTTGKLLSDSGINASTLSSQISDLYASKADSSALTSHTGNTSNPHSVTASQVGLGNVDNTSDANKPISTATQTALDAKADAADLSNAPNPYVEGVPLYSIGHSYTMYPYPYGTQYTGEYYMRIKDRLRLGAVTTLGRSGTVAADNFGRLISSGYDSGRGLWTPNSKGIVLIQNTMNELGNTLAGDTLFRNLWAQSIRGEIAVTSSLDIKGYSERSGVSGTWTKGGLSRDTKGINGETYFASYSSGAYIEWEVSQGDEVWVVGIASLSTYTAGDLQVICNGSTLATLQGDELKPTYTDTVLSTNLDYTPWAHRVTGLNAAAGTTGSKTVRVQVAGSVGNCFVSGIIEPSPNPPQIFLAKEPPRVGSAETTYNDNIAWYNSTTDTIAAEFNNVVTVDLATGWDNDVMVGSLDTGASFHPNDIGQSKIADNYVTAINTNITDWVDGVAIL